MVAEKILQRGRSPYVSEHLELDHRSKLLYCVIPKCTSGQLRKMLYTNRTKEEEAMKFLKRFPEQEQNVMLATFFKFIFVREPFERLLSAYKDKFVYMIEKRGP